MSMVIESAQAAKRASLFLASLSTEQKNEALAAIATALKKRSKEILSENKKDLDAAIKGGVADPLVKRLVFDQKKLDAVIKGIYSLIDLPDPVGQKQAQTLLDDNLVLTRVSAPIGVIGVIFESRPDALVQISTLCLKAGNAVLLKGGTEAFRTNLILSATISSACSKQGFPDGCQKLFENRSDVHEMLKLDGLIDLIIPRGSNTFVQYIMNNSTIPVLGHADGVCHLYVHEKADLDMAIQLAVDSKTQYIAVCNALETLVIDEAVASTYLPKLVAALEAKGVMLYGCPKARALHKMLAVGDWHHEYLDHKLSVRVVTDENEAIDHINMYGSAHTDAIVTQDEATARRFQRRVDSGSVMWNCSTRFSDGFVYGLGAEVGVSTSKIHARGPVGLEGLVTYKYWLDGKGHIISDYADGKKAFKHIKRDISS